MHIFSKTVIGKNIFKLRLWCRFANLLLALAERGGLWRASWTITL